MANSELSAWRFGILIISPTGKTNVRPILAGRQRSSFALRDCWQDCHRQMQYSRLPLIDNNSCIPIPLKDLDTVDLGSREMHGMRRVSRDQAECRADPLELTETFGNHLA